MFDRTLAAQRKYPVDSESKEDAKSIYSRPCPVPNVHKEISKKEVERLVPLGFLEVANDWEWVAPSFAQPKPRSNRVRFLSGFSNINKQLKQKPHEKINENLLQLEGFQYATSLDLNIGYYHIQLSENASNLCTIILPWGEYWYRCILMGFENSPDVFQPKMNELFHGFEFVRVYIDYILILTKGYWKDHVQKMELTLNKLKGKWLKFNIEKSLFGKTEMEYLGFWVTRDDVKPIDKKIESIKIWSHILPEKNYIRL